MVHGALGGQWKPGLEEHGALQASQESKGRRKTQDSAAPKSPLTAPCLPPRLRGRAVGGLGADPLFTRLVYSLDSASLKLFAQVLCLHFKQDERCKQCPSLGLRSASGVLEGRGGPSPHSVAHDRLPMEHDEIHKKWLCERTGSLETQISLLGLEAEVEGCGRWSDTEALIATGTPMCLSVDNVKAHPLLFSFLGLTILGKKWLLGLLSFDRGGDQDSEK